MRIKKIVCIFLGALILTAVFAMSAFALTHDASTTLYTNMPYAKTAYVPADTYVGGFACGCRADSVPVLYNMYGARNTLGGGYLMDAKIMDNSNTIFNSAFNNYGYPYYYGYAQPYGYSYGGHGSITVMTM